MATNIRPLKLFIRNNPLSLNHLFFKGVLNNHRKRGQMQSFLTKNKEIYYWTIISSPHMKIQSKIHINF